MNSKKRKSSAQTFVMELLKSLFKPSPSTSGNVHEKLSILCTNFDLQYINRTEVYKIKSRYVVFKYNLR